MDTAPVAQQRGQRHSSVHAKLDSRHRRRQRRTPGEHSQRLATLRSAKSVHTRKPIPKFTALHDEHLHPARKHHTIRTYDSLIEPKNSLDSRACTCGRLGGGMLGRRRAESADYLGSRASPPARLRRAERRHEGRASPPTTRPARTCGRDARAPRSAQAVSRCSTRPSSSGRFSGRRLPSWRPPRRP